MKSVVLLGALLAAAACSASSAPPAQGPGTDASDVGDGGPDLDTWANWAQGFFTRYCVECHGATNPDGLDFGVQATVIANKSTIRCGVCVQQDPAWGCPASPPAEQFPISDSTGTNPKPSDAERDRVVAWIDAGCP